MLSTDIASFNVAQMHSVLLVDTNRKHKNFLHSFTCFYFLCGSDAGRCTSDCNLKHILAMGIIKTQLQKFIAPYNLAAPTLCIRIQLRPFIKCNAVTQQLFHAHFLYLFLCVCLYNGSAYQQKKTHTLLSNFGHWCEWKWSWCASGEMLFHFSNTLTYLLWTRYNAVYENTVESLSVNSVHYIIYRRN